MQHRHLQTSEWTLAAIDSALEYGDLADWRELFDAVQADRVIAERVLQVARAHDIPGSSRLAETLVMDRWPELGTSKAA